MKAYTSPAERRGFKAVCLIGFLSVCLITLSQPGRAQSGGTIDAGTVIPVRTSEEINVTTSDGRVFSAAVDQDVRDNRGQVALPRGTHVELLVRKASNEEYVLDLES